MLLEPDLCWLFMEVVSEQRLWRHKEGGVLGTVTGADKIRPPQEMPGSTLSMKQSRHASYS